MDPRLPNNWSHFYMVCLIELPFNPRSKQVRYWEGIVLRIDSIFLILCLARVMVSEQMCSIKSLQLTLL